MGTDWRFGLLGPFEMWNDDRSVPVRAVKPRVLLASLLVDAGRVVPSSELIRYVWGQTPPAEARGTLYTVVSRLRHILGARDAGGLLVTRPDGYLLDTPAETVDLHRFRELVRRARVAADAGDPNGAADLLTMALTLVRGEPLVDIPSEALRHTVVPALVEDQLAAQEFRIELVLRLGRHRDVITELDDLTRRHPLRERFWELRMLALYRSGRQAEALECFRTAGRLLSDELGVDPGPALRDLHLNILRSAPELAAAPPAVPAAGGGIDLPAPRQLPADVPDFSGRTAETAYLIDQLTGARTDEGPRVAVLAGQGGIGKTTLAVRFAYHSRHDYPDGQLFVDLRGAGPYPLAPAEALAGFLRALDIPGPAIPEDQGEREALFRSLLADRRMLIILDNAVDEAQVGPLLPGDGRCVVIVTSRGQLTGLAGADQIELRSLSTDDSMEFLGRAVGTDRLRNEPRPTQELIDQCAGLPLALRISAARLIAKPHWRISDLTRRLRDARRPLDELAHSTLDVRSSLALSYAGLSRDAQTMLRRIAILEAPDFPAWAGAALLDGGLVEAEDLLEELVDAHLLQVTEHDRPDRLRYQLHDLVRAYAQEQAQAEETRGAIKEALGRAFGGWLALAEDAHAAVYGGQFSITHGLAPRWRLDGLSDRLGIPLEPLDWLDGERLAIRAAVYQSSTVGAEELCWDLAWTATTLYEAHGFFDDWRLTAEHALDAARRARDQRGTAAMLRSLASLTYQVRHADDDARVLCEEAAELFHTVEDAHGFALSRQGIAVFETRRGNLESALRVAEESATLFHAVGDRYMEAAALRSMAQAHLLRGDHDSTEQRIEQALTIFRELGGGRGEAQALYVLGELRLQQRRFGDAETIFAEFVRIAQAIAEHYGEAHALTGLGESLAGQHRYDPADQALQQALTLAHRLGAASLEGRVRLALGKLHLTYGAPDAWSHLKASADIFADLGADEPLARAREALNTPPGTEPA